MTIDPPDSYHKLIALFVEHRKKQALTQMELAEKLARPQSYVAKYELGTRVLDVIEFMEVCKALKLRPSKLMILTQ